MTFQAEIITFFFLLAIIGFYLEVKKLNKEEKEYKDKKIRETIINNNKIDDLADVIQRYNENYKKRNH